MNLRCPVLVLCATLAGCVSSGTQSDEDAAPRYRALQGRFPKIPEVILAAFDHERTDPADVDAAIASYEPLLEELSRVSRVGPCTWSYDTPPNITMTYPLDYALDAGKLFVVRSQRRLDVGARRTSLEDLLVLEKFGSDLLQDRWTIGKLIGVILGHWASWELQERLSAGRLDQADLERTRTSLAPLLQRVPDSTAFLRDERKMALPLLDEIRDLGLDEVVRRVAGETKRTEDAPAIVAAWHEWLQTILRKDIEHAKRRISERWDELSAPIEKAHRETLNSKELERQMAALKERSRALSDRMARRALGFVPEGDDGLNDVADLLFRLWVPALEKAAVKLAEYRLVLEMTHLACSLELRRIASGSYPDTPDILPQDPFVGGPIRYRRIVRPEGEGYVLGAAGHADDAEERMRVYSEECDFDRERFAKKSNAGAEWYSFGVFRRR